MWFISQHRSPLRSTHFSHRFLQRLDSSAIEGLVLIQERVLNCRYHLIVGPIIASQSSVFSWWGTDNSQMMPTQNMEGDQPVQSHSHAQQPLQQWNRTPFVNFPGRLTWLPFAAASALVGNVFPIDSLPMIPPWPSLEVKRSFHCMDCSFVSGSKWWTQH